MQKGEHEASIAWWAALLLSQLAKFLLDWPVSERQEEWYYDIGYRDEEEQAKRPMESGFGEELAPD